MSGTREYLLSAARRAPLVIEPGSRECLKEHIAARSSAIHERLAEHGVLLFRGFDVNSVEDFSEAAERISHQRMKYVHRSTPRTLLLSDVMTATEYPAAQEIPLHSENAYQRDWPMRVAFCCLVPAQSGGETPLADLRRVTAALPAALLDKLRSLGVRYVRNYHPHVDIPWRVAFQTESREEVARYCAAHHIRHEWLDVDTLRTSHDAQGVARHPLTGEEVFFNQAHLFHATSLGEELAHQMREVFGADGLPRHALYGDGSEIPPEDLVAIRAALSGGEMRFQWRSGDVLLIDNMQVAHGRRPYAGPRTVLTVLMDPHSAEADTGRRPRR